MNIDKDHGAIDLPGLRYGQTADIIFNLSNIPNKALKLKPDSKIKVYASATYKGKQLFP